MSSGRRIRQLARKARIGEDEALRLLADGGYAYRSATQSVSQGRLAAIEALLGLRAPIVSVQSANDRPTQETLASGDGEFRPYRPKKVRTLSSNARAESGPLRHRYVLPIVGHAPPRGMYYLDARAVLDMHYQLVDDFARSPDPIEPAGVRGEGELLESAISRPRTSLGGTLKYPTVEMAAAALLHALVHDHPFHNGNKRTAIVALLVFLNENGYVLQAEEEELFDYVLGLAAHTGDSSAASPRDPSSSDQETIHAARWVCGHVRKLNKAQKTMKWKDLEGILRGYGCEFDVRDGVRVVITRGSLTVYSGRANKGEELAAGEVTRIRKILELDEAHGVDSSSFYYNGTIVPEFINKYRKLLERLASY